VAWRNQSRCIVRLTWRNLTVFDRRDLEQPEQVFAACQEHLRWSTNAGTIRPAITIFRPGLRIHNSQLVGYAGFENCGAPAQRQFTQRLQQMGWSPSPGPFVVLPLLIGDRWFEYAAEDVLEVPLAHPDYPWFADLGLRWYALPAISSMELEIGGILYTAAPFSGHYMVTEVGTRDLGDSQRYNLLPVVAQRLGLDLRDRTSLWKDRALHELNRAVLWSYDRAGVSMVDHHTAAQQFLAFQRLEEEAGRRVSADWAWIVPPTAASTTPLFFTSMQNLDLRPAFRWPASSAS
jgi:nitric-oxide synthase